MTGTLLEIHPPAVDTRSDEERTGTARKALTRTEKAALKKIGKQRAEGIRHLLQSVTVQFETLAIQLAEIKADETEWKAMGYGAFSEYLAGEFGDDLMKCGTALRKAIVTSNAIQRAHLTQPELAAITGASERTIRRDQRTTGQVSGPVGKDGLVILDDPDADLHGPPAHEPDPVTPEPPAPPDHWGDFSAALAAFNKDHGLSAPTKALVKTIRFRMTKAQKVLAALDSS